MATVKYQITMEVEINDVPVDEATQNIEDAVNTYAGTIEVSKIEVTRIGATEVSEIPTDYPGHL